MSPEQRVALVAQLDAGIRPTPAARALGINPRHACAYAWQRRNAGRQPGQPTKRLGPAYEVRATVCLDGQMAAEIDRSAKAHKVSRNEMIRLLIEWGLEVGGAS